MSERIRRTSSPGDWRISRPLVPRSWAVLISTWIPLESMNASPPRSSVSSPPCPTSRPSASESIPTFEASSSPIRRNPRGWSVRSTVRSIDPPTEPVSTGRCLHGFPGVRKAIGPESKDQDRHVVPGRLSPEVQHSILDASGDGVGVEPHAFAEQRNEVLLTEDDVAGGLLGHPVRVEHDRVAGTELRQVVLELRFREHAEQVALAVRRIHRTSRPEHERQGVPAARDEQL